MERRLKNTIARAVQKLDATAKKEVERKTDKLIMKRKGKMLSKTESRKSLKEDFIDQKKHYFGGAYNGSKKALKAKKKFERLDLRAFPIDYGANHMSCKALNWGVLHQGPGGHISTKKDTQELLKRIKRQGEGQSFNGATVASSGRMTNKNYCLVNNANIENAPLRDLKNLKNILTGCFNSVKALQKLGKITKGKYKDRHNNTKLRDFNQVQNNLLINKRAKKRRKKKAPRKKRRRKKSNAKKARKKKARKKKARKPRPVTHFHFDARRRECHNTIMIGVIAGGNEITALAKPFVASFMHKQKKWNRSQWIYAMQRFVLAGHAQLLLAPKQSAYTIRDASRYELQHCVAPFEAGIRVSVAFRAFERMTASQKYKFHKNVISKTEWNSRV